MDRKKLVYIAGALTNLPEERREELRQFYEAIGAVCREHSLEPYVPHHYGDPVRVAHLTAAAIDRIDRLAVTQSYLVVAYVGEPSLGVGIEIEMALHANKPVLLLVDDGRTVSRLVRGNPAVRDTITFRDTAEACARLGRYLENFFKDIMAEDLPRPLSL